MRVVRVLPVPLALALGGAVSAATAVGSVDGRPLSEALFRMYVRNGQDALGIDVRTPQGKEQLRRLEAAVRDEMIDRTLVAGEAESRGLDIDAAALAERRAGFVAALGGAPGLARFLEVSGLEGADLDEMLRQELLAARLRSALASEIIVSEEELRAAWEGERTARASDLEARAEVRASHILVAARRPVIERQLAALGLTGSAARQAVERELFACRARAEELRARAQRGEDFSALARAHSDDPGSRDAGGDLGTFARGVHTAAFDDAVFRQRAGTVGPVVQTEHGFHVIKVARRTQARPDSFGEAAPLLRSRLKAQREAEHLRVWLLGRRARARIELADASFSSRASRTDAPVEAHR
jgi:parvulin-like peptidyl-prolyl isomerase